jgi:CRAL/TRIO domain
LLTIVEFIASRSICSSSIAHLLAAPQASIEECRQFPLALASMMERVQRKAMADDGVKPTQNICLIHVGRVPALKIAQLVNMGTRLATALNHNYPGRLHKMYVLDLPPAAMWFYSAVRRFVPQETHLKITLCEADAPEVPREFEPIQGLPLPGERASGTSPAPAQPPAPLPRRSLFWRRASARPSLSVARQADAPPAEAQIGAELLPAEPSLSAFERPTQPRDWAGSVRCAAFGFVVSSLVLATLGSP